MAKIRVMTMEEFRKEQAKKETIKRLKNYAIGFGIMVVTSAAVLYMTKLASDAIDEMHQSNEND